MASPVRTETLGENRVLMGALIVVLTLLVYLPVLHFDFLKGWDDDGYVTANDHVRTGLKPDNLAWAFRTFDQFNWHPVTWLSHILDCQLFGLNPGFHHYVNVLLHAANALLLFWLLAEATGATGRSSFAAALFAVHPLNVETVAWVAQRKSLLCLFFSLLAIAAYGWYVRRGGWERYALIFCAFSLALMSKPMAVPLPLLLLLFDYWPLNRFEKLAFSRRWSRLIAEKIPLLLLSAASSLVTILAQRSGGSVVPLAVLPFSTRFENAAISYVTYLGKILYPARLGAFYPHPASMLGYSLPLGEVLASTIVLLCVSAGVVAFSRARYLAVGWLFFLTSLIPVIGLVQVGYQGMADRYAYLPCIGVLIAAVWGIADVADGLAIPRVVLLPASLCLIAGFAIATFHYLGSWQNDLTLFSHARTAWGRPDPYLELLYANALLSSGRVDEALEHYQESCALGPRGEYCHYHIAQIMFDRGEFRDAIQQCQITLTLTSNRELVLSCLDRSGEALLQLGLYDAAQGYLMQSLRIDPHDATALRLREQLGAGAGPPLHHHE